MTYEYAVFFKLLLLCGYKDEMQQYLDNALIEQDPLSDIVLELTTTVADDKKALSVLNEYLCKANEFVIDYDKTVFDLVMSFLKRKYTADSMTMKEITDLMYRLAVHTERYLNEPWATMYYIGDFWREAQVDYIDKEDYQRKFDAFLNDKIGLCDYPPMEPKESFLKRIIKRLFGRR